VDKQELDRTVYLEPPGITSVTGDYEENGDTFTVIGKFYGSKPPKVMIEYLKNGDAKYKKCKIVKRTTCQFKDAKGKLNKSCMVVLEDDVTATKSLGYSEVTAIYPKLKDSDQVTGYIIIDNKIGLAVYDTETTSAFE